MKVANKKCIRRLSFQAMRATKLKNTVAVTAIALTTILFTSLFTIVMSLIYGMEQSNFRQVGGYAHGGFKYLTSEQIDEIKDDPLIKEYGVRLSIGLCTKGPFQKSHVEISYCDPVYAKWSFCTPIEGRLPKEGTREAATDLKVLELLGVRPEIGNEFTVTITVGGQEVTETFTLCGWWEHDGATVADHILIPEDRTREIIGKFDASKITDNVFGTYSLDVMYSDARHIEENNRKVLERHGYQSDDRTADNYIAYGVNWGYMSAQLDQRLDPMMALSVAGLLILIVFTGYLIIYNVFQISVSNDIRFYGMLKTIGTTGRQIRKILYIQAFTLSALGIPVGLAIGYGVGACMTSVIITDILEGIARGTLSTSPFIFVFSAAFALFTVIISCRRPAKRAARVSPIEALRYTEGERSGRTARKSQKGASVPGMAWANLGRNRAKTAITVISLALAVVLLNLTVTFTKGFDMEKYLQMFISADYLVADGSHIQVNGIFWSEDIKVDEGIVSQIEAQDGIAAGGRTYGQCSNVCELVTEEWYRSTYERWYTPEQIDNRVRHAMKDDGRIVDDVRLYGMEDFCLDKLKVYEGDLEKLHEGGRYVAAVYSEDDYGNIHPDSHWAKIGDRIKLRYVDAFEYYNIDTGEILEQIDDVPGDIPVGHRPLSHHDEEYEVVALVSIPTQLSYRHYGTDEFIMDASTFCQDTGTSSIMYYAFDMDRSDPESMERMEAFLQDLSQNVATGYDFESRKLKEADFASTRDMFGLVGGTLSFIVALVGILNFMNAIITGIITRKRELAVLQAVGMTGRQTEQMLMFEGVYVSFGAVVSALVLTVLTAPFARNILNGMFWFFTYRFTIVPILIVAPVFAVLGILIPYLSCRSMMKRSVVERLREME